MTRLILLSQVLWLLTSCGMLPPVALFDAELEPDPTTVGLVYYGETVGPRNVVDISIYRDDNDKPVWSNRAVVVLPAGDYTFDFPRYVPKVYRFKKGPDTPPIVHGMVTSNLADGATFIITEPERTNLRFRVEPGRCYRIYEIGAPPDDRFEVEEYWPADRSDIKGYCRNSQPE